MRVPIWKLDLNSNIALNYKYILYQHSISFLNHHSKTHIFTNTDETQYNEAKQRAQWQSEARAQDFDWKLSFLNQRKRKTVENISWSISMNRCCRTQLGSNLQPPDHQSDVLLTEPLRLARAQEDHKKYHDEPDYRQDSQMPNFWQKLRKGPSLSLRQNSPSYQYTEYQKSTLL